jgi:hypothetical protein
MQASISGCGVAFQEIPERRKTIFLQPHAAITYSA